MSGNKRAEINDALIREALQQEIDCVEVLAKDRTWENITSSLDKKRSSVKRRSFTWSRAAAVAAACLVLVLGGIGIFRNLDMGVPLADTETVPEAADEFGVLEVEEKTDQPGDFNDSLRHAEDEDSEFPIVKADPSPPDWPSELHGDYMLGEALLLTGAGQPNYSGAIYFNGGVSLLLVEKEINEKDLFGFTEHLGGHMQVALQDIERANGFIRFSVNERIGLAWQKDDRNQALLVLSGNVEKQELKNIAASID